MEIQFWIPWYEWGEGGGGAGRGCVGEDMCSVLGLVSSWFYSVKQPEVWDLRMVSGYSR